MDQKKTSRTKRVSLADHKRSAAGGNTDLAKTVKRFTVSFSYLFFCHNKTTATAAATTTTAATTIIKRNERKKDFAKFRGRAPPLQQLRLDVDITLLSKSNLWEPFLILQKMQNRTFLGFTSKSHKKVFLKFFKKLQKASKSFKAIIHFRQWPFIFVISIFTEYNKNVSL